MTCASQPAHILWHSIFVCGTEAFRQFLSEDFDVKDHANKVIQGMVITQQLGKLAAGISLLDKEIHTQVRVSAVTPHCAFLHCCC